MNLSPDIAETSESDWRRPLLAYCLSAALNASLLVSLALFTTRDTAVRQANLPLYGMLRAERQTALAPIAALEPPTVALSGAASLAMSSAENIPSLFAPQLQGLVAPGGSVATKAWPRLDDSPFDGRGRDLTTEIDPASAKKRHGYYTNFFGLRANGNDFVFIVDFSGSMRGNRFRRARAEVSRSVGSLEPNQQFFVIFFNHLAFPMPASGLTEASAQNVRRAHSWIRKAEPGGSTNPRTALFMALELEPDAVFLLTDGQFDPQILVEYMLARTAAEVTTPVHTIGFEDRAGETLLRELANQTGGEYRFVP